MIKKYIEFAIDNDLVVDGGARYNKFIIDGEYGEEIRIRFLNEIGNRFGSLVVTYNLIELITSKKFIEAVARGIEKMDYVSIGNYHYCPHVDGEKGDYRSRVAKEQAIHIMEGTLDTFITNLLGDDGTGNA